ncbi:MAG: hypothetical protein LBE31_12045 [Deltaproteobacteria bacterium]|jgi:hypothetical protein|nr:hypothetical protein [Deltaproteobacteria bacterium]
MDALKREWAALEAEKRKLYPEYRTARDEMKELYAAKYNAEKILGYTPPTPFGGRCLQYSATAIPALSISSSSIFSRLAVAQRMIPIGASSPG